MLPLLQDTEGRIFMSDTAKAFKNGKALIPFVTAGDPDLETTEKLLVAMSGSGADIIEIGIPFSDPIAEGVVIQQADIRALASGTTTDRIFDMIKRVRPQLNCKLAIVTYMNPIFVYGTENFMSKCRECGISDVIVPDVPFEEKAELAPACNSNGVELISIIAPAPQERITTVAKDADGFAYCVPSSGSEENLREMISLVKSAKEIPCAVDFKFADLEELKRISEYADGVIVSSEIVKLVAEYGRNSAEPVCEYIKAMKEAIR